MICDTLLTAVKLGAKSLSGTWRLTLLGSKVTSSSSCNGAIAGDEADDLDCSCAKTC